MKPLNYFHQPLEDYDILKDPRRKDELVKIMIQTLEDFGYRQAAQQLIEESHIKPETDSLSQFRSQVLAGQWNEASRTLNELGLSEENNERAQFLVHEQQYIELILNKQYNDGLNLLRSELTHRCKEPERLHKLASIMMCTNADDVQQKLNKNIDNDQARKIVLKEVQNECRPTNMMSSNRINKLLQQAVSYQIVKCKYHQKMSDTFSLLDDHQCELDPYPSRNIKTLRDHTDEVWIVKFSHDGNHIASVSKNNELRVWQFNNITMIPKHKYRKEKIHDKEVNCLNWSHDNKRLATASSDKKIKIWDAETGTLKLTVQGHVDNICSVTWLPNSQHFISGGIDSHVIVWDQRGEQLSKISSPRVLELLVTSDGKTLYAICAATPKIIVTDLVKKTEIHQIKEKNLVCAATLSKDNKFLLANTSFTFPELHLWSLDNYELVQTYTGHFQEKFRIGCCFGGFNDQFIACGGEDSTLKIFHRNSSEPLASLTGHSLTVNSVNWHPRNPKVLISGGDDHTVKIWVSEDLFDKLKENGLTEESHSMEIVEEENDKTLEEIQSNLFEEEDDDSQE
jgi:WD40 repeat protein